MAGTYEDPGPTRAEVNAWTYPTVLEFGAAWCGYCQRARPLIEAALVDFPGVRYVRVADARGRPLGRSFTVKLWPTLIFLKNGQEMARVVRPTDEDEVRRGLAAIVTSG